MLTGNREAINKLYTKYCEEKEHYELVTHRETHTDSLHVVLVIMLLNSPLVLKASLRVESSATERIAHVLLQHVSDQKKNPKLKIRLQKKKKKKEERKLSHTFKT